ncbi:FAD-binding protein [Paenibacillus polymyxa]|uniref:FAD-binding protein n=1 Tax=Paenibacillus polymyxa TaxID=1406 RepID=UPI000ACC3B86|nr:FAD-binding protein [Paenibacillus polymyxa]
MLKNHYDIIIIGAGAGGLNADLKGVELGKQVLLVEKYNQVKSAHGQVVSQVRL